jgi:transcriptional regulator with XRE-family HTH domain
MDLKSFYQDKLKLSQAEFAERIGVSQKDISQWENDANLLTVPILQKIAENTSTDFNTLLAYKKPVIEPLKVTPTWNKAEFTKKTLLDYISLGIDKMSLSDEIRVSYIDDLKKGIEATLVKPQITIVGRSDTGKSTMINALLGIEKMPTSWTPTTSIAVYIKHIADKPSFIKNDVWVFANHYDGEDLWNERRLYDEAYCQNWKVAEGDVEILRSFGTRQGDNSNKNAGSAVVFIDAPVLENCDIVDLPGFGTETESDDSITFKATQRADIIIYLSQANGFMRIEDITYLKRNIAELPVWEKNGKNKLLPLSNLFIVASQSHTINNGNTSQLKTILDAGCSNLLKTLPEHYWDSRKEISGFTHSGYGQKELNSRFFTYTTDIPDLCRCFNSELGKVLEALPIVINERTKVFVGGYIERRMPALSSEIKKYTDLVKERDKYVQLLKEIDENETERMQDNEHRKNEIRDCIEQYNKESIDDFSKYCSETVNTDALVALIKKKGVKNKKEDLETFGSSLTSMIQEKCESILKGKSDLLSKKTKEYISAFTDSIKTSFDKFNLGVDFDAGWAFVSALSKIGIIGGLAGFAAGFGALAAGIFVFGGMVAGSALVLGPLGIAIGLLFAVGLGIAKLFGGGWEKTVAKKIVKLFEENDVSGKFRSNITDHWNQTKAAFVKAATSLDKAWAEYVNKLRDTVEGYDIETIRSKIASLKNLEVFFSNIPLSDTGLSKSTNGTSAGV